MAAIGVCLFMVLTLAALQFVLTPRTSAPTFLFVLFVGLWIFGAAMLARFPRFGAVGTALWGVLSALGAWQTHANLDIENATLIFGSLAASGLAVGTLVTKDW